MRLLRMSDVAEITGLSTATIERREREGEFPARRQVAPGRVAWLSEEVEEWIRTRPAASPRSGAQVEG